MPSTLVVTEPPPLAQPRTVTWEEIVIAHLHAGAETSRWISLYHKARASRKLRQEEQPFQRVLRRKSVPCLRVNHAEASLRGFYPKCALYTPSIRRHSTSSHQLRGPRRPPGVPCAAVTPLQSPFPALQWHLLVTHRQECDQLQVSHGTPELLTLLAQLFSLRCRSGC